MCLDISTIDEPINHNTSSTSEPSADAKPIKKSDRPFYCMRCARQHPPTATHCDCRTPPVPLKSKNHPDKVKSWCEQGVKIAQSLAKRLNEAYASDPILSRGGKLNFRSEAMYLLFRAACMHDVKRGAKFTTFAYRIIKLGLSSYVSTFKRRVWVYSEKTYIGDNAKYIETPENRSENDAEQIEVIQEVRFAVWECLTPDEREVITQHFVCDLPLEQIADAKGINFADAFALKDRAISALRERLAKRLSITQIPSAGTMWQSTSLQLVVKHADSVKFENAARDVLTEAESFFVRAHFIEGLSVKKLEVMMGLRRHTLPEVLRTAVEKLRPYVGFESRAERLASEGMVCPHCRVGKVGRGPGQGFRGLCRACHNIPAVRNAQPKRFDRERKLLEQQEAESGNERRMRYCGKCKTEKSLFEFNRRKGYPEDRHTTCAACDAADQRLYKQKRRAAAQAAAASQEGAA